MIYYLTTKGQSLNPAPGSLRSKAWAIVRQYAGKPDGTENAKSAIDEARLGTITGSNMFSWAKREGLI